MVERNMSHAAKRGMAALSGSKTASRAKGLRRNLGDPASGLRGHTMEVRIGKARSHSR